MGYGQLHANRSGDATLGFSKETLARFLDRSLACPKCRGRLVEGPQGYLCQSCESQFHRVVSYIDFLDVSDPMLAKAQIDFTAHYIPEHTPYWIALREATEKYSSSLPAFFSAFLNTPVRCLDIGASHIAAGRIKPHLQAYERVLSVYCAIDPDPNQLACQDDRLFIARAVGEFLPFGNEVFDLVLIHATLDHCFDYGKALDELSRVLAPGGVASIYLNNDRSWAKRLLPWEARRRRDLAAGHHHVFLAPSVLMKEMRGRGFEVLRLRGMRYLLLPSAVLEMLARLCGSWTPRIIETIDRIGNWIAPSLGGDYFLFVRKRHMLSHTRSRKIVGTEHRDGLLA